MTLSREQLVLEELKTRIDGAALGPINRPAGLTVERARLLELASAQLPFVGIFPLEAGAEDVGALTQEEMAVKVAIYCKTVSGTPIDQALDDIYQWVHQQLLTDRSLGRLCMSLRLFKKMWAFNLGQGVFGDLDLHFLITFRHQAADPTRP